MTAHAWVGPEQDGILTVTGAFSDDLIERLYLLVADAADEVGVPGETLGGLMPDMKNSTDISLPTADNIGDASEWEGAWSPEELSALGYDLLEFDRQIFDGIGKALAVYKGLVPVIEGVPIADTGYRVQRYTQDEGFYRSHTDSLPGDDSRRILGVVVYLNDVEVGGETHFPQHGAKVRPEAGKVLVFPGLWTHPHESLVPVSCDKFIISTFIIGEDHGGH